MIYLLAKYALVFLLTGLLGFLLGRWWVRRSFVDVTESFATLRDNRDDAQWQTLWSRLDKSDSDVRKIVTSEVEKIPQPEIPRVDLDPLRAGIAGLEASIAAIPPPEPVTFDAVNQRIDRVESAIRNLPQPEIPEPASLDPVNQRIDRIEALIKAIPKPEKPEPVSFDIVNRRIDQVETAIRNIPRPEKPERVTLDPINQRIERLETALRSIDIPKAPELGPVNDRLRVIETRLTQLTTRPVPKAPSPAPKRSSGPRLLKSASLGKKDDLKRISGVGPKLERLLNRHGVYYFWQVAEWNEGDIKVMDSRLDVFKGRIKRDHWVRQARTLKKQSSSAPPVSGYESRTHT